MSILAQGTTWSEPRAVSPHHPEVAPHRGAVYSKAPAFQGGARRRVAQLCATA